MKELKGKVALATGGGSGIGRPTAVAFAGTIICFATLVCLKRRMPQITLVATGCPHPPNSDAKPLFTGQGDTDYLCGNCDQLIAEKIQKEQIMQLSVECPACGVCDSLP
jgi:NAD(P)-dependent dehydrogenase (short-subunit alcohol dehydrogenase family)